MTRILGGGVSTDVMRLAHNSVMIIRYVCLKITGSISAIAVVIDLKS